VTEPFISAAITAEIKRAMRYGRDVGRARLKADTGFNWHRLNYEISHLTLRLRASGWK